jgi:hypothetical protein
MNNQELERYFFEIFAKAYPLPPGEIIYADRPDVLIKGAQTVGIEITNFYTNEGASPASEQVQSKLRKDAVAEGHRLFQESGGANINVTFSFDKKHPIKNIKVLPKQLADLGHHIENWENGQIPNSVFSDITELDFVYLHARELQYDDDPDEKFPNGQPDVSEDPAGWAEYRNRREARALKKGIYKPLQSPGRWKLGQGHEFGLMSVSRLTEIIREKEVKARKYIKCDEYWLLIIVDFIDAAQEQEIRIDGLTIESDVFQKIIVYKPGYGHIVEITPRQADAR